ncbi:alpha-2C adrenergic receptor-like [Aplysia californica]|uniref:Alpha-2C adrenergic receptor-like n=1 Tax=Aplysia californica TaxID=6500 RepID=A0ABM1AA03_APLCA|nr:alpha-2C adrenergic receptor-like [Aplysia californica]
MTSTQAYHYVTPSDYFIPDRVIFTYTNESLFADFNTSFNATPQTTSSPVTSSDSWWWSHYPSGFSWPHIIVGAIIITVIILMIIIGNFLVMWAIVHDRTLKTTQNLFIASLAFADFFLGLIVIPFSLCNELMGYWLFGVVWCELYKAIDVLLCTASIMSLCLISLDRYWSITRAVHYARQRTRKRAAVMIFTVWFISAVLSIPPLIGWKQPTRESEWPLCQLSKDIGYVVYSAFGSFFIPAFIMVCVYAKIYQAAKQRARKNVVKPPMGGTAGEKAEQKHSTESSITEHPQPKECSMDDVDEPEESQVVAPGNMTEDTACDTAVDSVVPTSEDDVMVKSRRVPEVAARAIREGECSNLLSTDSDSEPRRTALNKAESGRPAFQAVPTSDTDSSEPPADQTALHNTHHNANKKAAPPITSAAVATSSPSASVDNLSNSPEDHNNGSLRRFKILELRANGTSSLSHDNTSVSQKGSVITTIRKHLFVPKRDSRRKKYTASRPESGKPLDFQTAERQKRKLAKARERRATVVLGLVMAAFILCWLPFFSLYLASAFCEGCIPNMVFTVFFWIGYCNSALNPIIYTVFNRDFRRAFQKILFGKRHGRW